MIVTVILHCVAIASIVVITIELTKFYYGVEEKWN